MSFAQYVCREPNNYLENRALSIDDTPFERKGGRYDLIIRYSDDRHPSERSLVSEAEGYSPEGQSIPFGGGVSIASRCRAPN